MNKRLLVIYSNNSFNKLVLTHFIISTTFSFTLSLLPRGFQISSPVRHWICSVTSFDVQLWWVYMMMKRVKVIALFSTHEWNNYIVSFPAIWLLYTQRMKTYLYGKVIMRKWDTEGDDESHLIFSQYTNGMLYFN